MSPLFIVISVIFIIGCLALIVIILEQSKRASGIGSLTGMGGGQTTYWDKNKKRSKEGKLELYTKIGGILFFVLTVVLLIIK